MTGPEHYRQAEHLLTYSDAGERPVNEALVHAVLALAAAVGGLDAIESPAGDGATGRTAEDADAWAGVGLR